MRVAVLGWDWPAYRANDGMATLYLHIGYPKTGTTTIQRTFFRERAPLLADEGLHYPERGVARPEFGHHNIVWEARSDSLFVPDNGRLEELLEEMRVRVAPKVLISSEAFTRAVRQDYEGFHELCRVRFADYRVVVIVAVRRIDEMVEASFLQQFNAWTWGRRVLHAELQDFVAQFDPVEHLRTLTRLLDSDLDVRYLPVDGNILARFVGELALSPGVTERLCSSARVNRRRPLEVAAVLARLAARPDGDRLREVAVARREEFERVLRRFHGDTTAYRLLPGVAARELVAVANPVYERISRRQRDFRLSLAVAETTPRDLQAAVDSLDERDRRSINDFFGERVL